MMLALLLQAAAAAAAPAAAATKPADPFNAVRSAVVEAIRDCGRNAQGELLVCSKDRGFAEGEKKRLRKLEKPKPIDNGAPIQITVSAGEGEPAPAYPGKP